MPEELPIPYKPIYVTDTIDRIVAAMDSPLSIYDAPYVLMGRENGKDVTEIQHLVRSLIDLLTTPLGSMPTLREYGCRLFEYIDRPMNEELRLDMLQAVYYAIDRWEPRLLLSSVDLVAGDELGLLYLTLNGVYLLEGRAVQLNNLTLDFRKEVSLSIFDL